MSIILFKMILIKAWANILVVEKFVSFSMSKEEIPSKKPLSKKECCVNESSTATSPEQAEFPSRKLCAQSRAKKQIINKYANDDVTW